MINVKAVADIACTRKQMAMLTRMTNVQEPKKMCDGETRDKKEKS